MNNGIISLVVNQGKPNLTGINLNLKKTTKPHTLKKQKIITGRKHFNHQF